mgnify:CR=1 FL=1
MHLINSNRSEIGLACATLARNGIHYGVVSTLQTARSLMIVLDVNDGEELIQNPFNVLTNGLKYLLREGVLPPSSVNVESVGNHLQSSSVNESTPLPSKKRRRQYV